MAVVAVVDYGMGNLDSVARAIEECGGSALVTRESDDLAHASAFVLPGVGAFSAGMRRLRKLGFDELLHEHVIERGVPLLGLCLGMQLLGTRGEEGGETTGLGLIPGDVVRLDPRDRSLRVPHVGWNEVELRRPTPLFDGIPSGKDFYFAHSYHLVTDDDEHVLAVTEHGRLFASVVGCDNVLGVQFHPEKSQRFGFQLLRNFIAASRAGIPAGSRA